MLDIMSFRLSSSCLGNQMHSHFRFILAAAFCFLVSFSSVAYSQCRTAFPENLERSFNIISNGAFVSNVTMYREINFSQIWNPVFPHAVTTDFGVTLTPQTSRHVAGAKFIVNGTGYHFVSPYIPRDGGEICFSLEELPTNRWTGEFVTDLTFSAIFYGTSPSVTAFDIRGFSNIYKQIHHISYEFITAVNEIPATRDTQNLQKFSVDISGTRYEKYLIKDSSINPGIPANTSYSLRCKSGRIRPLVFGRHVFRTAADRDGAQMTEVEFNVKGLCALNDSIQVTTLVEVNHPLLYWRQVLVFGSHQPRL